MTSIKVTQHDKQTLEVLARDVLKTGWATPPEMRISAAVLLEELAQADEVDDVESNALFVTMHSCANVSDQQSGRSHPVRLVFPGEADGHESKVSVLEPMGLLLLGRREGDIVGGADTIAARWLIEEIVFVPRRHCRQCSFFVGPHGCCHAEHQMEPELCTPKPEWITSTSKNRSADEAQPRRVQGGMR